MTSTTVLIPFEELTEAIELYLAEKHYIKDDEFLMYVDLGLEVTDSGMVELDVDIEKIDAIVELGSELNNV